MNGGTSFQFSSQTQSNADQLPQLQDNSSSSGYSWITPGQRNYAQAVSSNRNTQIPADKSDTNNNHALNSPLANVCMSSILQFLPAVIKLLLSTDKTSKIECIIEIASIFKLEESIQEIFDALGVSSISNSQ